MGAFFSNLLKKVGDKASNKFFNSKDDGSILSKILANPTLRKYLILGIIQIFSYLIVMVVIITIIFGPIMMAKQYVEDAKNDVSLFFEKVNNVLHLNGWCANSDGSCEKKSEQKYYEELDKAYKKYESKNIDLDVQLIAGTIFYGYNTNDYLFETDEDGINQSFVKRYCDANAVGWIGEKACEIYVKENYETIYQENEQRYLKIATNYDSLKRNKCDDNNIKISALKKIPSAPVSSQLDKPIKEVCEYYLWNYADLDDVSYKSDEMDILYKKGIDDIETLAEQMVSGNRIDYTKYRKYLIDKYIPKRFKEMYKNSKDEKKEIEKIADEIMLFASGKITVTNLAYNPTYASCSQVTINNHGNIEVHELEEYVAGVTTKENGGGGPEALKIQAILARSFAVKNCNRVLDASQNDQDYTPYASEAAKEATEATKGQILTYNGEILETISFASYPQAYYRGGFPSYEKQGYLCSAVTCNNESDGRQWCTTTLYKQPAMEKYELKMPNTSKNGNYWNSLPLTNQAGHCYGVSQVATLYYESELNYTYDKMINEFLSPGVEVSMMQSFMTGSIGSTYMSNVPMYETASTFYSNVNYNYYLSTSKMNDPENYGECPWYAQGRALEIVDNSNMPEERKQQIMQLLRNTRANGGEWYYKLQNSILSGSTDIYAAKPGSIITWASAGQWGHVGIIEDVEYDSNGKAQRVLITESWNGTGNPANASYLYSWQTIDAIRHYTSLGHGFVGYTYLLD